MARAVQSIRTGLHDIAKNRVVKIAGVDARTPDCFFRSVRSEIDRGDIRKRTGVTRHGRACAGYDDYIRGKHKFLSGLELSGELVGLGLNIFQSHDRRPTALASFFHGRLRAVDQVGDNVFTIVIRFGGGFHNSGA